MTDFEQENFGQDFGYTDGLEGRRPEQIEREIEATRERMSRDIDALGERLSPRNLAHEAMDSVSQRARRTGSRLADFVRENPLPVAAVGLGVTWLMTQRSKSPVSGDRMARYAYTGPDRRNAHLSVAGVRDRVVDRVGQAAGTAREAVSHAASAVAERAGELGSGAKTRLSDLGAGAKTRLSDLGTGAKNRAVENPLAVAAGALIIGLAAGLLLPETERENQVMGATRDRLADRAGAAAQRVADATADAADQVKDTVKAEITDRAPQVKDMARDVARRVVDEAKDAVGRVKEQVKNI